MGLVYSASDVAKISQLLASAENEVAADPQTSAWLKASDNTSLINKTEALMQTRQFSATESLSHLTDRTIALRSGGEDSGAWGNIRQDKGNHSGRSFYQTAITIGVDKTDGISTTGIMANINRGHDSGDGGNEKHVQAGVGIYNSLGSDEGLFLDSALSYQLYHQDLSYSSELGKLPGKADSNMVLFSARAGYTFKFDEKSMFVEPVVGLDVGYLDGYSHANEVVKVEQKSGYPAYAVAGLRMGKHWSSSDNKGTTLVASALRQQSIGNSAPGTIMSDTYKSRDVAAKEDNRYRFDVSLQSTVADNLSANVAVGTSNGNNFATDYTGRVGISYSF